jgi:YbbR domain-containing protein
VNPVISGSPAPGFRIASITVSPQTVTAVGDAEQLSALVAIDTAPVSVAGATGSVRQTVSLAPPSGIELPDAGSVAVNVAIEALTETRTYAAGLRLDGGDPSLDYDISVDRVLLTLFGPTANLDQLGAGSIVVGINVEGLAPGDHEVSVVPVLPSGVQIVNISPPTVTVTVSEPISSGSSAPAGSAGPVRTSSPGASSTP